MQAHLIVCNVHTMCARAKHTICFNTDSPHHYMMCMQIVSPLIWITFRRTRMLTSRRRGRRIRSSRQATGQMLQNLPRSAYPFQVKCPQCALFCIDTLVAMPMTGIGTHPMTCDSLFHSVSQVYHCLFLKVVVKRMEQLCRCVLLSQLLQVESDAHHSQATLMHCKVF